jgi:MFS family permease
MRLPSVEDAFSGARATFVRFPLALASGLLACVVAILMIDGPEKDWMPRLIATAVMGLALFTAVGTGAERRRLAAGRRWLANLVIAAGLTAVYLVSLGWTEQLAALRFIQLLVLAHLCVAVAPYAASETPNGFWHYNRFLLLRFLTAFFFAGVLFAGLSVALAALDKLFGVDVPNEAYGYLWSVLAFVFHPWFFLAGVPDDYEELDALEDYPRVLKVFSQFVLIPLVTVYLVILTAYLGKVLITRTWPSGWIGYLVSSVSAAGVLALLLVHPIRRRADSPWVATFSRWWFVVLLPSLVMLLLAVAKRIGQYGVTEERYFLVALTLWMLGISLYYGFTGSANIKRIPETLLLVAVLTAFGPWGAYAVSVRSQTARLSRIMAEHGMGRPGTVTPPRTPVPLADRIQISAVIRYLGRIHGPQTLARALGVPPDTAEAWAGRSNLDEPLVQSAMRWMGVEYTGRRARLEGDQQFWANLASARSTDVADFELIRSVTFPILGWIGTAGDSIELVVDTASSRIAVQHAGAPIMTLDVSGAVGEVLIEDSLATGRNLMLSRPILVEGAAGGYRVRLVLESVYGRLAGKTLKVGSANGFLLAAGFKDRRAAGPSP